MILDKRTRKERDSAYWGWYKWFAWYPVRLDGGDGELVWWEHVARNDFGKTEFQNITYLEKNRVDKGN